MGGRDSWVPGLLEALLVGRFLEEIHGDKTLLLIPLLCKILVDIADMNLSI